MSKKNQLLETPPYAIEQSLKKLGANLRTARIRRKLTIAVVAAKIGTGIRAISDAEKGKASTGVGIYLALLWAYDLLEHINNVADPAHDLEGQRLAILREKTRVKNSSILTGEIDNDF
jgi:transcriptional regulator with XRE-family HTH domain